MKRNEFTDELKEVLSYIQNVLIKNNKTDSVSVEYFIVSVLECGKSFAYNVLSKIMLHEDIGNTLSHYKNSISNNTKTSTTIVAFDNVFEQCIDNANTISIKHNSKTINSGHLLLAILNNNVEITKFFKRFGVTARQVNQYVFEEANSLDKSTDTKENTKETKPSKKNQQDKNYSLVKTSTTNSVMNECERLFTNVNNQAKNSKVNTIYGNEDVYHQIYKSLSKRNKNNIVVVGDAGVGKTDTVRNLSNLIITGKVPKQFKNKTLLEVDFNNLFSGMTMRGAFEIRLKTILNDAMIHGNYIFFIDSIDNVLEKELNISEIEMFLESIMKDRNIMLVCTCSEKKYSKYFSDNAERERYFDKVVLSEPSDEDCIKILKQHAKKLQTFHQVTYDEDVFDVCIQYVRRYITERRLPDAAIDILDETGAENSLYELTNKDILKWEKKIVKIQEHINKLKQLPNKDYEMLDKLFKKEIKLQSSLDESIKKHNLEKQPSIVSITNIKECIAKRTGIPLQELTVNERQKLKDLNQRIKKIVIGQDEAIDEVCLSIKKQRLGVTNPNKPIVFFMAGSTGVGKTYLAKTIAKEVFGSEKKIVRLDMSEYADKTSVNKIIGSSAGYVGFDQGGILTEAIKKQKHCVLLLDEIEKANEEVHNAFLSLFDEGRLTDNKGVMVDFKNVIIIMTSNVGAKKLEEHGNGIGFVTNTETLKKDIIQKELKRKFKPEFINRIDKIIYFNKLTEENIKDIIKLELQTVKKRFENAGYYITNQLLNGNITSIIFNKVREIPNMGARPIMRAIQSEFEDKLTNYIIDNDIKEGHKFKKSEITFF